MASDAHRQGRDAFQRGENECDCPYPSQPEFGEGWKGNRYDWFSGYFEARADKKLEPMLRRMNKNTPGVAS